MNRKQTQLQDAGRALYKRRDYAAALKSFNEAIGRGPTVALLDNRAACHEKLQDFPSALQDAKKAIQLAREDPTGYLRAGKVLSAMGKRSVALEIYSHGLKSVKHVGLGYELLRKVHAEVLKEVAPPKSVDPLTQLPRELAEMILEFVSFKQRMNACLVSKEWAGFIRSAPALWAHLDLSGTTRKVRTSFISRAINVGRKQLIRASLSMLYDFDKTLDALIQHCPLQDLELIETGVHTTALADKLKKATHLRTLRIRPGTRLRPAALKAVMEHTFDRLETFEFALQDHGIWHFTSASQTLQRLHITGLHTRLHSPNLQTLLPNLRHLLLYEPTREPQPLHPLDLSNLPLESLDLSTPFITAISLTLPPSLTSLKLRGARDANGSFWLPPPPGRQPHDPPLQHFQLPLLEVLDVDILNTELADLALFLGLPNAALSSPLRALAIRGLHSLNVSRDALQTLLAHPRLHSLEQLTLNLPLVLTDDHLVGSLERLEGLRELDLSETDVTGVTVRGVVEMGRVRRLRLRGCRGVGGDAVVWARGRGVRVEWSAEIGTGGKGRKVRG